MGRKKKEQVIKELAIKEHHVFGNDLNKLSENEEFIEKKIPEKKSPEETQEKSIKVSEKLGNFDVVIDAFGQIQARYNVDDINAFLNDNVDDKKLKGFKNGELGFED